MPRDTDLPTAKVYQFPVRRDPDRRSDVAGEAANRTTPMTFGSSWYHDEAIAEAEAEVAALRPRRST